MVGVGKHPGPLERKDSHEPHTPEPDLVNGQAKLTATFVGEPPIPFELVIEE
jgi:hypothetical protein